MGILPEDRRDPGLPVVGGDRQGLNVSLDPHFPAGPDLKLRPAVPAARLHGRRADLSTGEVLASDDRQKPNPGTADGLVRRQPQDVLGIPIPADHDARPVQDDDARLQLLEKLEIIHCQAQEPHAAAGGAMDPRLAAVRASNRRRLS